MAAQTSNPFTWATGTGISLTDEEKEAIQILDETFRMGITPYYLGLMDIPT